MRVAILMGSDKDMPKMQAAADVLAEFGVDHDVHVMSAHRTPERVAAFATGHGPPATGSSSVERARRHTSPAPLRPTRPFR